MNIFLSRICFSPSLNVMRAEMPIFHIYLQDKGRDLSDFILCSSDDSKSVSVMEPPAYTQPLNPRSVNVNIKAWGDTQRCRLTVVFKGWD